MQFRALVEEWPGESMVFFRELPGCFATAVTTDAALQAAPAAITRYFRWLKANDLSVIEENVDSVEVVLSERLPSKDGSTGPLFVADRAEPDAVEIDNALNVSATARALIIEIAANIPVQQLEQAITPGNWSLMQHLRHVLENEIWYVSRLQERPVVPTVPATMSADDVAMKIFEDAMDNEVILRELTLEQRTGVFEHDGEEWTAAKVLRRQAEHLYEHLLCMAEMEIHLTTRK